MKVNYNIEDLAFDMIAKFERKVKAPENATAAQLKEFNEVSRKIMVDPTELISDAFERIFNEPYDDGSEDTIPKPDGEQEAGHV